MSEHDKSLSSMQKLCHSKLESRGEFGGWAGSMVLKLSFLGWLLQLAKGPRDRNCSAGLDLNLAVVLLGNARHNRHRATALHHRFSSNKPAHCILCIPWIR